MAELNYSIKAAAERAGLSPHVLRVWEKRYAAVQPKRTGTQRRFYSNAEIERLTLLRLATAAGHTISHVVKLPTDELKSLIARDAARVQVPTRAASGASAPPQLSPAPAQLVEQCLQYIKALDADGLSKTLDGASLQLGQPGLLQQILVPLIEEIGHSWRVGKMKVAHEHIATAVIRTFLGGFTRAHSMSPSAPQLVITTPAGQLHELGAILAAAAASNYGWQVTYLGPCLPADEIAGAALQVNARAVALSVVYPEDDPHLGAELIKLRRLLPPEIYLLVGGRAASAYGTELEKIGATQLHDLPSLYEALDQCRKFSKPTTS